MPNAALESLVGAMTLADLAARTGRSIESIVAYAYGARRGGTTTPSARATAAPKRGPGRPRKSSVDTRSAAGRESYEQAVYEAVANAKDWINAQEIRRKVSGTPQQVRAALHRLLGTKKIKSQGRARATRYTAR